VTQREPRFLSVAVVMALHSGMMEGMGQYPAPLRDPGGLESAVLKPQMAAHYEGADVVRQAALLAVGISQAQAYVDGNKRTAYMAALVFLRVNGHAYDGDYVALAEQLEAVALRTDSLDTATRRFETWLREHTEDAS
jgi:death-on-curing protein